MILANKRRRQDFFNQVEANLDGYADPDVQPLIQTFIDNFKNADICDTAYKSLFKVMRKKSEHDFKE